ncbi:MAG: hypothetical protein MUE94_10135 [Verrucomicrobia bacterium]|jgi:hypothetical protein|nr:hypothetical protein [Verrucomicrobiota bacterium]
MAEKTYPCDKWCDIANAVLCTAWKEVPGDEWRQRIPAVKSAMKEVAAAYKLSTKTGGPKFDTPARRMAYCALHLPSRARWVFDVLRDHEGLFKPLFAEGRTTDVWSIGGGPGSDLLGFFRRHAWWGLGSLKCYNFDREAGWAKCMATLQARVKASGVDASIELVAPSKEATNGIGDPRVILLSYVLSDVFYRDKEVGFRELAESILSKPKPGALVVFLDIARDETRAWSEERLARCGYAKVGGFDFNEKRLTDYQWGRSLGRFDKLLDLGWPHRDRVTFGLWRRMPTQQRKVRTEIGASV